MHRFHRRDFFRQSAAIGLAAAVSPVAARSVQEKLNIGFVGLGGRGGELLGQFGRLKNVRIAALCDPDQQRLDDAASKHIRAAKYADPRELMNDRGVDAVVIATCNHWHALCAILACQAGKDVYVEKPLAHNHWEGQQIVRAARAYDRIVQVGTQQRSDPLQLELKQFLHDDQTLGAIRHVQVCRFGKRDPIGKRSAPLKPPESLDYNLWLGPAQDRPIFRNQLHYDWHWDWNTGNGELGNWGIHVLDDAINVVLRDRVAFPKRVLGAGGRVAWADAGETPNVCFVCYDTGSIPLVFGLSNLPEKPNSDKSLSLEGVQSGYIVYCEGGYYTGWRGGGRAHDKNGNVVREFEGDSGAGHARNFVDAVFAHDPAMLNAEVQVGHQSTAWCNLADIAIRVGGPYSHLDIDALGNPPERLSGLVESIERQLFDNSVDPQKELRMSPALEFDKSAEQFIGEGAEAANRLLRREHRASFEVPAIS